MTERGIARWSLVGTALVLAGMVAPGVLFIGATSSAEPVLETIEAALAYKANPSVRQPQKPVAVAPVPEQEAAARKEAPPPPGCKRDAECPSGQVCKQGVCQPKVPVAVSPDLVVPSLDQFRRADDDEGGPLTTQGGQFDGSDYGFAEENKGDPYFRALVGQLREGWEFPTIAKGEGEPVGCFQISAEGRIVKTLFKERSGAADLDQSVERAMEKLKKARDDEPLAVPSHLLAAATTRWICFRFKL